MKPSSTDPIRQATRVTLGDVARRVGLSPSTVSLALNGHAKQARISEKTLAKIQKAAGALGYRPNYRARALASQRSHLVAFSSARSVPLITGANQQITEGAIVGLARRGYYPLIVPLLGDPAEWEQVLSPDRLDGAMLASPLPPNPLKLYQNCGLPMVAVNVMSELPITHVIPDEYHNTRLATECLIRAGHRRIVYIYPKVRPSNHFSVEMRQQGYESLMREAGLMPQAVAMSLDDASEVLAGLRQTPARFTAAVIYDHNIAFDFLVVALHEKIALPQRLSIVTFNIQAINEVTYLPLSTITVPGVDIGRIAAEELITLIETPQAERRSEARVIRLPGTLVERKSVLAQTAP